MDAEPRVSRLLYRLHPATGAEALQPGSRPGALPKWWHELPEDVWERTLSNWLRNVMEAVAERGESKLFADFSDHRGVDDVLRLPGCVEGPRPLSVVCEATPTAIDALLETSVSQFVQTLNDDAILYADGWDDGLFVCIDDDALVERFSDPVQHGMGH